MNFPQTIQHYTFPGIKKHMPLASDFRIDRHLQKILKCTNEGRIANLKFQQ